MGLYQTKKLLTAKETAKKKNKPKRHQPNRADICKQELQQGLISKIYKELTQLHTQKKLGAEDLNRHSLNDNESLILAIVITVYNEL